MEINTAIDHNWNNSLRTSIVLHFFLLLIAWWLKFESDPDQNIDTQYAVTVSFQNVEFKNSVSSKSTKAQANAGRQRPKSEAPQKIETAKTEAIKLPTPTPPKPSPPTPPVEEPTPTDPVITETTTDVSDIQAVEEEIEVDEPEPEYIPEESPEPIPNTEPAIILNPELPSIDDIIGDINDDPIETEEETNYPSETEGNNTESRDGGGLADDEASLKDGEEGGTGRADQGSGAGNGDSGNDSDSGISDSGYGEGEFDASGDGIFGRKVTFHPYAALAKVYAKSGKIWIKTCVNRSGRVTYVEIDELNTTVEDRYILRDALEAARQYKFEEDFSAPREQCGVLRINVDNFRGIRG